MIVFREEAVIAENAERVWEVLTDLARYNEWNPWIVGAEGSLAEGAVVWVDVILGKRRMRAKHVVEIVDPPRRFVWRDAGWNALLVSGRRSRTISAREDGSVLFSQELRLGRPLAGLAERTMGRALRSGMAAETAALAARAAGRVT